MDLSIIIPSFKRADLLKFGLRSIARQKTTSKYEIIVVNDGLEDDTKKVCDSFKSQLNIRYIFTGQRNIPEPVWRIPGFAINIGAKMATGDFMLIMCPEMYLLDDGLQGMIDTLKSNPKHIVITNGKDDQDAVFLGNIQQNVSTHDLLNLYDRMPKLNTEFPFFLGVSTKEFIEIGGYDEDFIGNCWDDQDIVTRLKQNGLSYEKLGYRVVHLYHSRIRYSDETTKKMWDYNKNVYDTKFGLVKRNVGKIWGNCLLATEAKETNDLEKHFTTIYEKNVWNGKESRSGTGSDLVNTAFLRPLLVEVINSLNIESVLDLPCGDFNWMRRVIEQLQIKEYLGGDIIPAMIKDNEIKYSGTPILAAPKFTYINMLKEVPPKADLILCRDGLVHFSFDSVKKILNNFIMSGSTYLLTTTFVDNKRAVTDIKDGEWRPINFYLPPFNFPPPKDLIVEKCVEGDGLFADKCLALWKLSDLKKFLEPQPAPSSPDISLKCAPEKQGASITIEPVDIPKPIVIPSKKVKLRVAHIHPWWDSAGVGIMHTEMMNKYTNIGVRHIVAGVSVLKHSTDLILGQHDDEIKKVLKAADILHFNTFWHDDPQLKQSYLFPWKDYLAGKKLIFHMHGGAICFNYKKLAEISEVATMYTCSPLLPKFMPFTTWVPNIIPIYDPLYSPKTRVVTKPVKFLAMVNHDHNKGRAELEWLFFKLNNVYGYKISFESWLQKYVYHEALEARKDFDVVIDNITQGFIGMVGWETLCQEQVCIARLSPIVLENYTKLGNGEAPPIINVSGIDELAREAVDLNADEQKVQRIQKQGREWMEKYYNPEKLCKQWERRYTNIMKNRGAK
jgi:glycosyltransferase involved in cell wall biosynthesis